MYPVIYCLKIYFMNTFGARMRKTCLFLALNLMICYDELKEIEQH